MGRHRSRRRFPERGTGRGRRLRRFTDLGNNLGRILVDDDAAGWGWFVDPTPGDDREFAFRAGGTQMRAVTWSAINHIDLLTVLMHEVGHSLGYEHTDDEASLMSETLSTSVRRLPEGATPQLGAAGTSRVTTGVDLDVSIGAVRERERLAFGSIVDQLFAEMSSGEEDGNVGPHRWSEQAISIALAQRRGGT